MEAEYDNTSNISRSLINANIQARLIFANQTPKIEQNVWSA